MEEIKPKLFKFPERFDWLIILDACRYDYFKRVWDGPEPLPVLSPGSCTIAFLDWMPRVYNSVVVTGHPFVLLRKDKFDCVVDAGFDDKLNTCPPRFITETLFDKWTLISQYKRKILWFLQPHHPHIGNPSLDVGIYIDLATKELNPQARVEELFRRAKQQGILSRSYMANLRLVLDEIREILEYLSGTIVITSDHGEGLGEPLRPQDLPVFSHPCNREEWEVRLVPFVAIYKATRAPELELLMQRARTIGKRLAQLI